MANYMIIDGDGTTLSMGHQGYDRARASAERRATERGESVYLVEEGDEDAEQEEVEAGPAFTADSLTVLSHVTIDGTDYVVYTDGAYTHAVSQPSWTAHEDERYDNREGHGYTAWCQDTDCVSDTALARAIVVAAQEQGDGVHVIHLGGTCVAVSAE